MKKQLIGIRAYHINMAKYNPKLVVLLQFSYAII